MPIRHRRLMLVTLALALLGYWSPWLTHPAASLRLNGYELSEWVTFLPGVHNGSLALSRLSFLVPLACLSLILSITASLTASPRPRPASLFWPRWPSALLGWILLFLALLCSAALFPAYPYILTAYKDPEFQFQFFIACAIPFGILLTFYLPTELKDLLQIPLALLGGAYGLWSLLAVRPAATELLDAPWAVGLGWVAMLAGFAGLIIASLARTFGPRGA